MWLNAENNLSHFPEPRPGAGRRHAVVCVMMVPLPPIVLDLLLSVDIGLAVVLLLTIYIKATRRFSVFPSLLLLLTLVRLSLNVASTHDLILMRNGRVGVKPPVRHHGVVGRSSSAATSSSASSSSWFSSPFSSSSSTTVLSHPGGHGAFHPGRHAWPQIISTADLNARHHRREGSQKPPPVNRLPAKQTSTARCRRCNSRSATRSRGPPSPASASPASSSASFAQPRCRHGGSDHHLTVGEGLVTAIPAAGVDVGRSHHDVRHLSRTSAQSPCGCWLARSPSASAGRCRRARFGLARAHSGAAAGSRTFCWCGDGRGGVPCRTDPAAEPVGRDSRAAAALIPLAAAAGKGAQCRRRSIRWRRWRSGHALVSLVGHEAGGTLLPAAFARSHARSLPKPAFVVASDARVPTTCSFRRVPSAGAESRGVEGRRRGEAVRRPPAGDPSGRRRRISLSDGVQTRAEPAFGLPATLDSARAS